MLEIIFVILLCRQMGKLMRGKGRKPLMFQIMLVIFWLGGEVGLSFLVAVAYVISTGGQEPNFGIGFMLIALAGGALGAGLAFLIASLIPAANTVAGEGSNDRYANAEFQNIEIAPPRDPNNPYQPPST